MKLIFEFYLINDDGGRNRQQNAISNEKIESVQLNLFENLDEPLNSTLFRHTNFYAKY